MCFFDGLLKGNGSVFFFQILRCYSAYPGSVVSDTTFWLHILIINDVAVIVDYRNSVKVTLIARLT